MVATSPLRGMSAPDRPQPPVQALQTALGILNRELCHATEENGKLHMKLEQLEKELQGKEENCRKMRGEMDKLIRQLSSAIQMSPDDLAAGEEGARGWLLQRMKEELQKDGMTTEKRFRKAMYELLNQKKNDDTLRKKLKQAKEELERVRKDCGDKERKLEGDLQQVRNELAGTMEELMEVRKQLREEEKLRKEKGSELRLKEDSFRTPSRFGGVKDSGQANISRSLAWKRGRPLYPMEPSKKPKLELEPEAGGNSKTLADSSSSENEPIPCITLDDSDSDSKDGSEEPPQQAAPVAPANTITSQAQAPEDIPDLESQDQVSKAKMMTSPTKAEVPNQPDRVQNIIVAGNTSALPQLQKSDSRSGTMNRYRNPLLKGRGLTRSRTATSRRIPAALMRLCGNPFPSRSALNFHIHFFKGGRKRCDICGKSCSSLSSFNKHKKIAHFNPNRRAPTTSIRPGLRRRPKEIRKVSGTRKDIRHGFLRPTSGSGDDPGKPGPSSSSPSGGMKYVCMCGQQFPSNEGFVAHMKSVKLEGKFKCAWCSFGFKTRERMIAHQKKSHRVEFFQN